MNEKHKIRWYKTMVFKLTLLVSVSILVFSAITIFLQARRSSGLYTFESVDCKIKLATALEQTIRDDIMPEYVKNIATALDKFVEQNYDVAYLCVKGPRGVLVSSAGPEECPEYPDKKELAAYSTEVMRVSRVVGAGGDVGHLEILFYLSPEKREYGSVMLGFYEMDAIEAERFRKVINLERYIASSVKRLISSFSFAGIDTIAGDMAGEDTNIRYVIVTDGDFKALSHPDSEMKFKRLEDKVSKQSEKTGPYNPIMIQYAQQDGEEIMDVAMGLFDDDQRLGGIRIGYSLSAQKQRAFSSALKLALIALIIIVIALVVSIIIARRIASPVVSLSGTALRIGEGDLETEALYKSGGDEIRMLYDSFNQMISGLKERDFVKDTFGRYMTKQVADEILNNPDAITPGGKRQEVTILFSDIRGFTSFSEHRSPEEVVSHLNEYMSAMVDVIIKYEGVVDKFIGDAIMAVYGSPLPHDDDPLRAVKSALEMQQSLVKLNEKWKNEGKDPFKIGIGLNTGDVIVGNIGDIRRMEYTVIGDNVNLASRIEGLTKNYDCPIIISESTYSEVKNHVVVNKLEAVTVKGKSKSVEIYELLDLKS